MKYDWIVQTMRKYIKFSLAKYQLMRMARSEVVDSKLFKLEALIIRDLERDKKVKIDKEVRVVNTEKFFFSLQHTGNLVGISDQIKLFRRVLRTRGRLRWLCFRLMKDVFPDAYEISRLRLLFEILMNRSDFKKYVLFQLFFASAKPEYCKSISSYEFTHPDSGFKLENDRVYFLEENLNAPLVFRDLKNSKSNLLDQLIIWNSSMILRLMRLSPNFLNDQLVKSRMVHYPDLMSQYNSTERFSVLFHDYSALTLSERKDQEDFKPDVLFNAEIWHQRFILQDKKWMVTDITGSPYTHFVAGHWQFLDQSRHDGLDAFIKIPSASRKLYLTTAIHLMGRADENWYHLLLDTLPRYLYLKEIDSTVPVLIRSDLPKSSLDFIGQILNRQVILVKPDEVVLVGKLYFIASRSTVFDSKPPNHFEKVKFPNGIFQELAKYIFGALSKNGNLAYPDNLYLPRKSKYRNLVNESSIAELAIKTGYSVVESNLDFYRRQWFFFRAAQSVLSPGGAVLANIIFMQPGSRVLLLRSWRDSDLRLWKKLAESCGVHFSEAIGVPTYYGRKALARQHSDYFIPIRRVRKLFKP